jgi:hypothetical protein
MSHAATANSKQLKVSHLGICNLSYMGDNIKQNMWKFGALAIAVTTLTACELSPRASCIRDAETEVRQIRDRVEILNRRISEKTSDINRGYAIHSQQQKIVVRGTCVSQYGYKYDCPKNDYQTIETPVSINLPEERNTRKNLKNKRDKVFAQLTSANSRKTLALKQCQLLPDE